MTTHDSLPQLMPIQRALVAGIDVSRYQGKIDWKRVAATTVRFVYAKATEGATLTDKSFVANWDGARAAGLKVGIYHYMSPSAPAGEQVANFLRAYRSVEGFADLPPVLDIEEAAKGETPASVCARSLEWLRVVEDELGVKPLLYTFPSFARTHLRGAPELAEYQLWIAHVGAAKPSVPPPWSSWWIWQHSHSGRVDGIGSAVDLNCARAELLDEVESSG